DLETLRNELTLMGELTQLPSSAQQVVMRLYCDLDETVIRAICGFVIHEDQMQIKVVNPEVRAAPAPSEVATSTEPVTEAVTPPVTKSAVTDAPVKRVVAPNKASAKDSGTIRVPTGRVDILV